MAINNKYFIPNRVDVTQIMLNECVENSIDDLRVNDTGLKVIMKGYDDGNVPPSLSSYPIYTHAEILTELANTEWTIDL